MARGVAGGVAGGHVLSGRWVQAAGGTPLPSLCGVGAPGWDRDPPSVSAPAPSLACCFTRVVGEPSPEVGAVDTQTLQKPRPEQQLVGQGAQGSHSEGPGLRDKLVSRDEGTKGLPWVPGRGTRTRARPRATRWPHLRGVVSTEDRRPECSRAGGTGGSTEWPPRALEPWGATSPAHGPLGPQPPACSHLPGALRQSLPPTSWKKPPQTSSLWGGHVLGWDRRSPRRLEDEEQRRVGRLLPDLVSNRPAAGGTSREPQQQVAPQPGDTQAHRSKPRAASSHSDPQWALRPAAPGTGFGQGLFPRPVEHEADACSPGVLAVKCHLGIQPAGRSTGNTAGGSQQRQDRGRWSAGKPRPPLGYGRRPQHRRSRQRGQRVSTRLQTSSRPGRQQAQGTHTLAPAGRACSGNSKNLD